MKRTVVTRRLMGGRILLEATVAGQKYWRIAPSRSHVQRKTQLLLQDIKLQMGSAK